jgi:hypothetical protein
MMLSAAHYALGALAHSIWPMSLSSPFSITFTCTYTYPSTLTSTYQPYEGAVRGRPLRRNACPVSPASRRGGLHTSGSLSRPRRTCGGLSILNSSLLAPEALIGFGGASPFGGAIGLS